MPGAASKGPWRAAALLVCAAAALAWAGRTSLLSYTSSFPPPQEIHVPRSGAAADMLAVAFGARRLFADLWFVRLMQYYGTRELKDGETAGQREREEREAALEEARERAQGGAAHHHHGDIGPDFGGGKYPEFLARSRHVLELDPGFVSAGLYSAGSLAFNLNRPAEAEELLRFALLYRPREWKYLQVMAAIGYSKAANPAAVAESLKPVLRDPECPAMLKQLSAFLNKRAGNYAAAAAIYADILATSRDPFYVDNARRELAELSLRTRG